MAACTTFRPPPSSPPLFFLSPLSPPSPPLSTTALHLTFHYTLYWHQYNISGYRRRECSTISSWTMWSWNHTTKNKKVCPLGHHIFEHTALIHACICLIPLLSTWNAQLKLCQHDPYQIMNCWFNHSHCELAYFKNSRLLANLWFYKNKCLRTDFDAKSIQKSFKLISVII